MRLVVLVCLAALTACASKPSPRWVSTKSGAVEGSDEFVLEEAQCRTMARGANPMPARTGPQQSLADIAEEGGVVMAQNRVTDACLRSRGWVLVTPPGR